MPRVTSYGRIGIIGSGRVASALGLALAELSVEPLALWGRDPARCATAVASIGRAVAAPRMTDIAETCDLIVLAVSDDALEQSILDLGAGGGIAPPFIFHVSGRNGAAILAPLGVKGWLTAAIHPAMTFTGDPHAEVGQMIGARFAVTGSTDQANEAARAVVAHLGGIPVDIAEEHRPLYHAALCHGANHLITLIAGSCEALAAAGVDDPAALLAPLVRAALENSLGKGMAGLSGPLLRGDKATIAGHISALRKDCPPLLPPYQAMGLATLDALERLNGKELPSPCRPMLEKER
ncbi:Rossmann-like and DUF2520 domain-containing protein [Novosphingobium sp. Chol11]|uniref:Rossmann-like and DUF2520 domain-containing protein n=1 Tax=Novosphingobium sp. Chol11 TaxID=1385763 RepID=UPI000BE339C4|nr:DUF2520 domain-containing protein [Novosphingobium sp. Chol11]